MNARTSQESGDLNEDDEVADVTALFAEADRLEVFAYSLLDAEDKTDTVLKAFTEAKALADAKRTEAYQAWLQLRRP